MEEAIKNLGRKLMEELPEAVCAKASKEGNMTSCSLPTIPTLCPYMYLDVLFYFISFCTDITDLEDLEVRMPLDETEICQQKAKCQECIQQEIWNIAAESY